MLGTKAFGIRKKYVILQFQIPLKIDILESVFQIIMIKIEKNN